MLERCVYYDGLTAENVDTLHKLATQNGMNSIRALNRRAAELKATQAALGEEVRRESDNANQRVNFGVYFYYTVDDQAMKIK